MLNLLQLAIASLPLLVFVQFNPWLKDWQSRKVLHMGTGTLFILSDVEDPYVRIGIYIVAFVNVAAITRSLSFHFADKGDIGIISYLLLCSFVAFMQIPFYKIAPLFYADPFGAIVGRTIETQKLVGSKSVGGTAAVFVVAFLTLFDTPDLLVRLFCAAFIAFIELVSGKLDNPCIGMFLVVKALLS